MHSPKDLIAAVRFLVLEGELQDCDRRALMNSVSVGPRWQECMRTSLQDRASTVLSSLQLGRKRIQHLLLHLLCQAVTSRAEASEERIAGLTAALQQREQALTQQQEALNNMQQACFFSQRCVGLVANDEITLDTSCMELTWLLLNRHWRSSLRSALVRLMRLRSRCSASLTCRESSKRGNAKRANLPGGNSPPPPPSQQHDCY